MESDPPQDQSAPPANAATATKVKVEEDPQPTSLAHLNETPLAIETPLLTAQNPSLATASATEASPMATDKAPSTATSTAERVAANETKASRPARSCRKEKPSKSGEVSEEDEDPKDRSYRDPGDEGEDDEDNDDDGGDSEDGDGKKNGNQDRPKRRIFKGPREYMAWLHATERELGKDLTQTSKRPASSELAGDRKRQMTSRDGPGLVDSLVDEATRPSDGTSTETVVPPAPTIAATSIREQIRMLANSVPDGADTRRTSTQKKDVSEASRVFGFRKVKARDGQWLLSGMVSQLLNHQLTASAWMIKRELAEVEPRGGLLCDYMGMGKTIMSLACILGNPPDEKDIQDFSATTLVVVPNLMIARNWLREAKKHYKPEHSNRVAVYDASAEKPLENEGLELMILITTYREMFCDFDPPEEVLQQSREGSDDFVSLADASAGRVGFLLQQKWYRVILDEAHAIKNDRSRTKMACCALQSKNNWALSGTPLANSALELFPYLQFTRCPLAGSRESFKRNYLDQDGKVNSGFESLVSMLMYRRMPEDAFLGHRILELPKSEQMDIWVPLSDAEYAVHRTVTAFHDKIQQETKRRKLGFPSAEALEPTRNFAKLLRLRSLTSHFFTLENWFRNTVDMETLKGLKAALQDVDSSSTIMQQVSGGEVEGNHLAGFEKGLAWLRARKEPVFGGKFEWQSVIDLVESEMLVSDATCGGCDEPLNTKCVRLEPCGHYMCWCCHKSAGKNNDQLKCKATGCDQKVDASKQVTTLRSIYNDAMKDKRFEEPGRDVKGIVCRQPEASNSFSVATAREPGLPLLPSTKLTAAMAVVMTWLEEHPDDKIIIYFNFLASLKVMGSMLNLAEIDFLYYVGCMGKLQRSRALRSFEKDPSKKILISTLRAGGQALNLTVANRVIIIDPWWNTTLERQAFCRVLRMGQKKPSYLVRILAGDQVDSRIFKLQGSKDEEISHALQDDGHVPQTMNEAELASLFDQKGKPDRARKIRARKTAVKRGRGRTSATRR
ncbi:hypothetical protein CDD80_2261 [Ophiocordyceps camponoti-rufipedis]|uniref:Uncharacterized protein n=1 Tax=Ophiocordyceps camponoti-rufipedis TaxID=2004952 RepID=A0A2C5Z6Z3_9HYPO|nr:hypothetical protein CDD80_2261 [Ophiocordyceps camponoti-rufipedis]